MEKTDNPAPGGLGGITYSIQPGVACPATVLVVVLSNGGYLLVGYLEGICSPWACIMDGRAGAAEQEHYAQRLIAVGERLRRRAEGRVGVVIEGEAEIQESLALPVHAVEPVQCDRRS